MSVPFSKIKPPRVNEFESYHRVIMNKPPANASCGNCKSFNGISSKCKIKNNKPVKSYNVCEYWKSKEIL